MLRRVCGVLNRSSCAGAWALRQFNAAAGPGWGAQRVDSVRRAVGWSAQRFISQFSLRAGLTPKRYLRVLRFHSLVHRLAAGREDSWAQLAADGGYADQSHLIREFRAFSGLTPGGYRAVAPDQASHVAISAPT